MKTEISRIRAGKTVIINDLQTGKTNIFKRNGFGKIEKLCKSTSGTYRVQLELSLKQFVRVLNQINKQNGELSTGKD